MTLAGSHAESWRFVSIPDLINYDVGSIRGLPTDDGGPDSSTPQYEALLGHVLDAIKAENPDFVLVAGDLVMGHWERDSDNRKIFGPVGTLAEKRAAVNAAADHYYPIWKRRFEERGLIVHAALGDHEIGDNDWGLTDPKSQLVWDFKEAFARHFTQADGQARYPERPLGTPYENTAYAFRHRNGLFVTVDVFQQEVPLRNSGQASGTVIATVDGGQLAWLRKVLLDAKDDPQIRHVFVQGHTPCLGPVRKRSSSGLLMQDADGATGENTTFWRVIEAARIDAYLCGEVHDITSSRLGDIQQIAHGALVGQHNPNFMVVTVSDERIEYVLKEIPVTYGGQAMWQTYRNRPQGDGVISAADLETGFREVGRMVVDKRNGARVVAERSGVMLNAGCRNRELVVHLPMDGTAGGVLPNLGSFGANNQATLVDGAKVQAGILGNGASLPDARSRLDAGPAPAQAVTPRTVSTWVRLPAGSGQRAIVSMGLKGDGIQWELLADTASGSLMLSCGAGRFANASAPSLSDGQWHHIACAHDPGRNPPVALYVDGQSLSVTSENLQSAVPYNGVLRVGQSLDAIGTAPALGMIDDLAIWQDTLTEAEVRALCELGLTLGYHAGTCENLLQAHSRAAGYTAPDGKQWHYHGRGIDGAPGIPRQSGDDWLLPLGGGGGMATTPNLASSLWQHFPLDSADAAGFTLDLGAAGSGAWLQGAGMEHGRMTSAARLATGDARVAINAPNRDFSAPHSLSFWIRDAGIEDGAAILSSGNPGGAPHFRWVSLRERQIGFRTASLSLDAFVRRDAHPRWHQWTWIQRSPGDSPRSWEFYLDGGRVGVEGAAETPALQGDWQAVAIGNNPLDPSSQGFIGKIDDYALWDRPLTPGRVRALHELAMRAGMNAGDCNRLFEAFDRDEPVTIRDRVWEPVNAEFITGQGRLVTLPDGRCGICLADADGMATSAWEKSKPSTVGFSMDRGNMELRWPSQPGASYRVVALGDSGTNPETLVPVLPSAGAETLLSLPFRPEEPDGGIRIEAAGRDPGAPGERISPHHVILSGMASAGDSVATEVSADLETWSRLDTIPRNLSPGPFSLEVADPLGEGSTRRFYRLWTAQRQSRITQVQPMGPIRRIFWPSETGRAYRVILLQQGVPIHVLDAVTSQGTETAVDLTSLPAADAYLVEDATSEATATVTREVPTIRLHWSAAAGKLYRITASDDLRTWPEVLASDLPSTGTSMDVQAPDPAMPQHHKRFYRVEEE
jgi:hypothetical protein